MSGWSITNLGDSLPHEEWSDILSEQWIFAAAIVMPALALLVIEISHFLTMKGRNKATDQLCAAKCHSAVGLLCVVPASYFLASLLFAPPSQWEASTQALLLIGFSLLVSPFLAVSCVNHTRETGFAPLHILLFLAVVLATFAPYTITIKTACIAVCHAAWGFLLCLHPQSDDMRTSRQKLLSWSITMLYALVTFSLMLAFTLVLILCNKDAPVWVAVLEVCWGVAYVVLMVFSNLAAHSSAMITDALPKWLPRESIVSEEGEGVTVVAVGPGFASTAKKTDAESSIAAEVAVTA